MKRFLAILCVLVLATVCCLSAACAEENLATYQDNVYSFKYPASWKQGTAKDGTVVLELPGGTDGVLTFAIVTDLIRFTGDEEADEPFIKSVIEQYSGKSLSFTGEYEPVRFGDLLGYRAYGKWGGTQDAHMIYVTDDGHSVVFTLIGESAIAEEAALLESVVTSATDETATQNGYKTWKGAGFSLFYPEGYGSLEQSTGTVFLDAAKQDQIIMVRSYTLDSDYTDALAPSVASAYLPKSTKVEAAPVMEQIGTWNAAVIRGDTASGPLAFYVIGKDRTALALLFIGNDALGYSEDSVASVVLE